MASKPKDGSKLPILKGQEAEDKILQYLKAMNRPYGAVDVAANLKGAVQKTNVQKILVALAEKGELVQKTYGKYLSSMRAPSRRRLPHYAGKTTFFVVNQSNLEVLPAEDLASLETELKATEEENTSLSADVKGLSSELGKAKSTPTDDELGQQIASLGEEISQTESRLRPLRSGAPPISAEDMSKLQSDWEQWKVEWFRRRKVFLSLWSLATDALPPQDSESLGEALGIEKDTPEHEVLERGPLCAPNSLKRKRR